MSVRDIIDVNPAIVPRASPLLVFKALCHCARNGERCPTQEQFRRSYGFGAVSSVIDELRRAGKIKVEVYGRNWRVIEIMEGEFKGCRTMEPPHGGKPYKVLA